MRRKLIAGNWKMNMRRQSAIELASAISTTASENLDVLVCPPDVYLESVGKVLSESTYLGGQNASSENDGAFTGETSCEMLLDCGCRFVILGHSERRWIMGETDEIVNKKAKKAIESGLLPIICVGEKLEERESGHTSEVIQSQIVGSLTGLDISEIENIVVAYEPVWAIGTGKVATTEQAQDVHADLRKLIENRYNSTIANQLRILYGGSVKPDNAGPLLGQPDIDGALVGGASLNADSFNGIIAACR